MLRTVFVASALTGLGAAAADHDGNGVMIGEAGTDATGISSEQVRPSDS